MDFDYDFNNFPTVKYPPRRQLYNTRAFSQFGLIYPLSGADDSPDDDLFEFDLRVKRLALPNVSDLVEPSPLDRLNRPTPWPPIDFVAASTDDVRRVLESIQGSGSDGVIKSLLVIQAHLSPSIIDSALATLAVESPSRIFWAGYDTARVVAAIECDAWMVSCNMRGGKDALEIIPGRTKATPRRWVDIWGHRIDEEWQKACRAVLAHVFTRPGIGEVS